MDTAKPYSLKQLSYVLFSGVDIRPHGLGGLFPSSTADVCLVGGGIWHQPRSSCQEVMPLGLLGQENSAVLILHLWAPRLGQA